MLTLKERERGNDRAASTARKESRNSVRNRSSLSVPYFSSSNLKRKSLECHKNLTELEVRSGANACFATELDKPFFCFGL